MKLLIHVPNLSGGLFKPSKFGHGWVITSHIKPCPHLKHHVSKGHGVITWYKTAYVHYISTILHTVFAFCGLLCMDFSHLLLGYLSGTGGVLRLLECQWNDPEWRPEWWIIPTGNCDVISKLQQNCVHIFWDIAHQHGYLSLPGVYSLHHDVATTIFACSNISQEHSQS